MRKALLLALASTIVLGPASAASALEAPSALAKKKCTTVVKIVNGHKRKVRVCHTVKPKALPTSVSVTLDGAHAATASVTADTGATLTAGRVTLTVPAGAVSAPTNITMTPVTRVAGLPGTVLGAVQFEPDGLQLLKPIELTFDVSTASGLGAFTYSGNGTEFHLYPMKVENGRATLELTHFSGYGAGQGLPPPSVARLRTELETFVKPQVLLATTNSGAFKDAVERYVSWKKEMSLLSPRLRAQFAKSVGSFEDALAVGLKNVGDEYHSDCLKEHDLSGVAKLRRGLTSAVLGGVLDLDDPAVDYVTQQIDKCERFELDFDSTLNTGGGQIVMEVGVRSLKLNRANHFSNKVLQGFDYASLTWTPLPCGGHTTTQANEPFNATILDLDLTHSTGGVAQPSPKLAVFVGTSTETVDWACPLIPPFHLISHFWNDISAFHGNSYSITIDNWDSFTSPYAAHKEYTGIIVATTELTTFVLRHTPE
jgi:hypothetical protein